MKILMNRDLHAKLKYWVDKADGEISGLGRYVVTTDGNLEVKHIYLLEQENSSASTELDAAAITKLMFTSKDDEGYLNFWWHSHANMGVFWSGTDDTTIAQLAKQGACLATVFNKRGETKSRFACKGEGLVPALDIDNLTFEVIANYPETITKEWDEEFKAKIKVRTYANYGGSYLNRDWEKEEAESYGGYYNHSEYASDWKTRSDFPPKPPRELQESDTNPNFWPLSKWKDKYLEWNGAKPPHKNALKDFKIMYLNFCAKNKESMNGHVSSKV